MTRPRTLLLASAIGLVPIGCRGQIDEASAPGGAADGGLTLDGSGGGDGPYRITCSVYHRDLGAGVIEHARESIVLFTDQPSERAITIAGGAIPVEAKLGAAADAPELVDLTLAFPRSGLERQFRLSRGAMPPYELIGFHGFTGLNYVTTPGSDVDVQFVCEASPRDEERPKPLPGPGDLPVGTPPSTLPPPTPFQVRCSTSVGEGATAKSEVLTLTGPVQQTIAVGGRQLELQLYDDAFEGRSFIVRFPGVVQQLYQLGRTTPLLDVTRGAGGLTGRTIVRSPAAPAYDGGASDGGTSDVVSVACAAGP